MLVTALAALLSVLLLGAGTAVARTPVDDYAPYQPQKRCSPQAKPGTVVLARWVVRRHGGALGGISRPCRIGGVSEHKEGRAIDWTLDARSASDRGRARAFLQRVFATDRRGNPHAKARRMGIMYVIWNDRIWSAYDRFDRRDYLHSSCKSRRKCSRTLRHRDHVHISLSRKGGFGRTSWYARRL
jgi:hypothetical protein